MERQHRKLNSEHEKGKLHLEQEKKWKEKKRKSKTENECVFTFIGFKHCI